MPNLEINATLTTTLPTDAHLLVSAGPTGTMQKAPATALDQTASKLQALIANTGSVKGTVANNKVQFDIKNQNSQVIDARDFGWVANPNVDQTSNLQNAINQATPIGGKLFVPAGVTVCTNLLLPYIAPNGTNTLNVLEIIGASHPAQFFGTVGNSPMPTFGTVLQCVATSGSAMIVNAPNGAPYGGQSLLQLVARNLTLRVPNPGVHGLRAGLCCQLITENVQIDNGQYSAASTLPTGNSTGLETPIVDNGALTQLRNVSISGFEYGLVGNEHTDAQGINLTSNVFGLLVKSGCHSQYYSRACFQRNRIPILIEQGNSRGYPSFYMDQMNIEHSGPGQTNGATAWQENLYDISDPGNFGRGRLTFNITVGGTGQIPSANIVAPDPSNTAADFVRFGATGMTISRLQ